MPITRVRSKEIGDGGVKRSDLNTTTTNDAVIAKIIAGENISIVSTGIDSGTGDVTISANISLSRIKITQAAHLLSTGNVVKVDINGLYKKAQANNSANAEVVGYVDQVIDANTFYLVTQGIVTGGVPPADPGTVIYLSPSVAGGMVMLEPTAVGQISKPIGVILEEESKMLFVNMRGYEISEDDTSGEFYDIVNTSSNYTTSITDNIIMCNASSGSLNVTLPTAVNNSGKLFTIKKIDSTFNKVFILTQNNETIDGELNCFLETPGEYVDLVSDNTNWQIIGD